MKYIFSLNHYNYARWLSAHVNDLMRLPITNQRLYEEFLAGNFVFQKSNNSFSAMALDQAHEQNNAVIKGAGGVIGLLTPDMESALRRWEITAPDVGRLIAEYEHHAGLDSNHSSGKHHEDYLSFQEMFFSDVNKVYASFTNVSNPFEVDRLITLHNGKIMSDEIKECLSSFLRIGEVKYEEFCNERLEMSSKPLTVTISNHQLHLPFSIEDDKQKNIRVVQTKKEQKFAKSIFISLQCREEAVKECFQFEVTEHPSITDASRMYHSNKSDLLKRFRKIDDAVSPSLNYNNSAMVIDLSVVVNVIANRKGIHPKTFSDFCLNYLIPDLMKLSRNCNRLDIVTDSYREGINLKENLQIERGVGKRLHFNDESKFPSNFASDFLHNTENKRDFYPYVIDKIIGIYQRNEKIVVATNVEKVVTNLAGIIQGLIIPDCSHYEADTRIIIHVLNCLQNRVVNVFVKTNDTDIIVLLTVYLPKFLEYGDVNIVAFCGIGNNSHYLSINKIGNFIGLQRCPELQFLHSVSGCDYTSSFF